MKIKTFLNTLLSAVLTSCRIEVNRTDVPREEYERNRFDCDETNQFETREGE